MFAGCSVAGVAGNYVAVAVVVVGAGDAESFGGTFLVNIANHHPGPLLQALLHFCK